MRYFCFAPARSATLLNPWLRTAAYRARFRGPTQPPMALVQGRWLGGGAAQLYTDVTRARDLLGFTADGPRRDRPHGQLTPRPRRRVSLCDRTRADFHDPLTI